MPDYPARYHYMCLICRNRKSEKRVMAALLVTNRYLEASGSAFS